MSSNENTVMRAVRVFFGIFMIVVYFGMAYLLATNFFGWTDTKLWTTVRWVFAAVFGLYGVYRCYRQVTGKDYYRLRNNDDDEAEYGYYEQTNQTKSDEQDTK